MHKHVTNTAAICNTYVPSWRHVRTSLTTQAAILIACSLIITRLDYCNSLLYGTSAQNFAKLQCIQNNLAKTVLKLPQLTSISSSIKELHWLRVPERVHYRVATLTFNNLHTSMPVLYVACIRTH